MYFNVWFFSTKILSYFWWHWVLLAAWRSSLLAGSGAAPHCRARTSLWRLVLLWTQALSVGLVVAKEFSGAVACLSFPNQGSNPALAGRFLATGPPGKSSSCDLRETFKILEMGLPCWPSGKNLPANAGDIGLIPGLGRVHVLGSNSWSLRPLQPASTSGALVQMLKPTGPRASKSQKASNKLACCDRRSPCTLKPELQKERRHRS